MAMTDQDLGCLALYGSHRVLDKARGVAAGLLKSLLGIPPKQAPAASCRRIERCRSAYVVRARV